MCYCGCENEDYWGECKNSKECTYEDNAIVNISFTEYQVKYLTKSLSIEKKMLIRKLNETKEKDEHVSLESLCLLIQSIEEEINIIENTLKRLGEINE